MNPLLLLLAFAERQAGVHVARQFGRELVHVNQGADAFQGGVTKNFPYLASTPPVFILNKGFQFCMWRKYGVFPYLASTPPVCILNKGFQFCMWRKYGVITFHCRDPSVVGDGFPAGVEAEAAVAPEKWRETYTESAVAPPAGVGTQKLAQYLRHMLDLRVSYID